MPFGLSFLWLMFRAVPKGRSLPSQSVPGHAISAVCQNGSCQNGSCRRPDTFPCLGHGLRLGHWETGTGLQGPPSAVGGLETEPVPKAGGPPEKGLQETLFTSPFYSGRWGRHASHWDLTSSCKLSAPNPPSFPELSSWAGRRLRCLRDLGQPDGALDGTITATVSPWLLQSSVLWIQLKLAVGETQAGSGRAAASCGLEDGSSGIRVSVGWYQLL